jgi:hypothetical protein
VGTPREFRAKISPLSCPCINALQHRSILPIRAVQITRKNHHQVVGVERSISEFVGMTPPAPGRSRGRSLPRHRRAPSRRKESKVPFPRVYYEQIAAPLNYAPIRKKLTQLAQGDATARCWYPLNVSARGHPWVGYGRVSFWLRGVDCWLRRKSVRTLVARVVSGVADLLCGTLSRRARRRRDAAHRLFSPYPLACAGGA